MLRLEGQPHGARKRRRRCPDIPDNAPPRHQQQQNKSKPQHQQVGVLAVDSVIMATLTLRASTARQARRRLGLDKPVKGSPGLSPEEARHTRRRLVKAFRQLLHERYPVAFPAPNMPPRAPLKIGIDRDLRARHPDLARKTIKVVLHRHVSQRSYQALLVAGAVRLDLDGNPAGAITAEEARHAAECLQRRLVQVRAADRCTK